jgi:glycosyltransferase involved in cell wall biosynthesis
MQNEIESKQGIMSPRISVIIPVYNCASYLSQALDGVRAQTVQEWELIIVDDGSTDDTGGIARSYVAADSRVRIIRQPNSGVAVARNRGFAEAHKGTELCIFLDADDFWQPDALQVMSSYLDDHQNAVAVQGLARFVDANGAAVEGNMGERQSRQRYVRHGQRLKRRLSAGPLNFATLARKNVVLSSGAVLIRSGHLRCVGGFDQSLAPVADWDMWLRLCRVGEIGGVNRVVLNYRQHGSSMSHDAGKMLSASNDLYRKHILTPGHTLEQALLLRIGRRYRYRDILGQRSVLAQQYIRQRNWSQVVRQIYEAKRDLVQVGGNYRPIAGDTLLVSSEIWGTS